MKKSVFFLVLSVFFCLSTVPSTVRAAVSADLPTGWYSLPEDREPGMAVMSEPSAQLGQLTQHIFETSLKSASRVDSKAFSEQMAIVPMSGTLPKDWTPWHLEMFTTDLAVSVKGLIGVLGIKGTPAIQVFWRKQGAKPATPATVAPTLIALDEATTPDQINAQIEPAVRAAVASGQVKDVDALKKNLRESAQQFQLMAQAADSAPRAAGSQWWVSGLRVDFTFEASGKVHFATEMGGDIRLRLEWKRLKRKNAAKVIVAASPVQGNGLADGMKELVSSLAAALEQAVAEKESQEDNGFKAAGFRVGFGIGYNGNIGVVKAGGSAIGHINFSRDVKKPKVYPSQADLASNHPASSFLMIEEHPTQAHLQFAANRVLSSNSREAIYRVDLDAFKAGLIKAMKMGDFFADSSAKSGGQGWKVAELKAGFDVSFTGDTGLAAVNEIVTAEMGFYNMNF